MTAGDGTGGGRRIGQFHPVRLLGHHLEMPLGPYRLAAVHRSPILTVIALRQTLRVVPHRHPPLPGCPATLEETQQQFAAWLEPYLAQAPGQWHFWDEWDLEAESQSGRTASPWTLTEWGAQLQPVGRAGRQQIGIGDCADGAASRSPGKIDRMTTIEP